MVFVRSLARVVRRMVPKICKSIEEWGVDDRCGEENMEMRGRSSGERKVRWLRR